MSTTKLRKDFCPACGRKLDATTGVNSEDSPSEGDISFCLYCGEMLTFSADLTMEVLSQKDFNTFSEKMQRDLLEMQKIIRTMK